MDIKKEITAIKKRLTHLESHSAKPQSKKLVEDVVIRREREEDNPRFTDRELQIHTELHKKNMLVPHKHKPSTSKQFHIMTFGTPEEQAEKKKKEDARIAADRANLAVEREKEEEWRRLIKNCPPQSIKTELHKLTLRKRSLPYAWVSWKYPKVPTHCKHLVSKGQRNYKIMGFTIEVNGSAWPMLPDSIVKRRLLRSFKVGSKVRIGVNYQWENRNGITWSCFKWRRS